MTGNSRFSLITKIVLLAVLNVAVLALVFVVFLRFQLRDDFESFLLETARERILAVSRLLALELPDTEPAARNQLLARYSDTYGVTFILVGGDGERLAGSGVAVPPEVVEWLRRRPGPGARAGAPVRAQRDFVPSPPVRPFLVVSGGPLAYWVGVGMPLRDERTGSMIRATLLLASPTLWGNPFFVQWQPWLAIAGVAVIVSLTCWLPMVVGLTRSISQMMQATSRIAEGQFDVSVQLGRRDELGSLGASINRMASRLASYVHGQKRFLGDIAHELRSPLARMQAALGILERRSPAETQTYVADLEEEVQTMSRLTDELIAFAKTEVRPESVRLEPVNVDSVVREAVRIEGGNDADIRIDVDPSVQVLATREYLLRAMANLIRNAVRYAGGSGPIHISARRDKEQVHLSVADSGPGVPEEALEKIMTPFYRLEESRDRRSGGTGLGLAIVRSSIEACGGSVECRNREPAGLEIRVILQVA